jgi:cell division protein FtsI (penicillin-binding protein 3)
VVGRILLVVILALAGLRLVDVQTFQAPVLSAKAEQQRATDVYIPAQRGTITDRSGAKLAFSVDAKALYVQPKQLRAQWNDPRYATLHKGVSYDQHTQVVADEITRLVGNSVNEPDLLTKLRSNVSFAYLAWPVEPAAATQITTDFPEIGTEDRSWRVYPDGSVASNIIGDANWRMDTMPAGLHGVLGLEHSMDAQLAGRAGRQWVDTQQGNNQVVIPNTVRDAQPAVPGANVQLTIDADVQYEVQQKLAQYVAQTGAKNGSAVVLDAHTGQIYALADDTSFNPNNPTSLANATPAQLGDAAITTPYEPGSVNKIVTAAAAIDEGLVTPNSVINIPSELRVADRVIHDDWVHPNELYTVTGVFAKSSNIGADELAQQVGPQRYYDMLMKMGLSQPTGVELAGESAGYVPPLNKWSGSTFGNLPIGQGLDMTVLQMAGMYQAIANDGVRIPPRIIASVTQPNGTVVPTPQPAGIRVVSPQTAQTVRMMMRAVTQKAKSPQMGTGISAAVPGYQVSGKTGTGQQIDPICGCYSTTKNTVTFAGILSADNPRFVVGIMLDAPNDGAEGGQTAAPLFHEIASYLAQKYQLPVSTTPTPYYPLVVQQ